MFGFLNIYKPKDITSHDVVSYLRRVTKIKQIGHTGTLDPFAEGVLPVCIGKSTRLIEYLSDDKAYIATVQFGKTTDTYDIEGEVLSESDIKVKEDELLSALTKYRGEIEQIPPKYSAIKVNGKKLYEYARAGVEVEIKPRKVVIEEIKLLSFDSNLQAAEIYIKCSKGTYIRTIGYDLGQDLGCGAYLSGLKRVQAGDFSVEDSIPLYDFKTVEDVEKNLIPPIDKLPLKKVILDDNEYKRVSNGMPIKSNETGLAALIFNNSLTAVGIGDSQQIKVKKFVG